MTLPGNNCAVCAERVAAGLPACECVYCMAGGSQCPWGHDYPRSCPSAATEEMVPDEVYDEYDAHA
jgi:hypothetical protein